MDIEGLVTRYCEAWFHPDPAQRRRLLAEVFESDGLYVDPSVRIEGLEKLLAHIEKVIADRPGFALERTGLVDEHHGFLRFGWRRLGAEGFRSPECIDVCQLSAAGKLALVIGFFGPMKSLPNSATSP